jgi:uncharacterized membrane protein YfcA
MDYMLFILFFLVALIYSSAGFGGGSLYLAILSHSALPVQAVRSLALLCNGQVTLLSVKRFAWQGYYRNSRMWILLACSIPCVFIGAAAKLENRTFYLLLAACLIAAGALIQLQTQWSKRSVSETQWPVWTVYLAGAGCGLLAGMTGIGGGIYLAPVLYFAAWGDERRIAATTSLFIAVNSLAGIAGIALNGQPILEPAMWPVIIAVFLGGLIGSWLSVKVLPLHLLRMITSAILIFVGVKLLFDHL